MSEVSPAGGGVGDDDTVEIAVPPPRRVGLLVGVGLGVLALDLLTKIIMVAVLDDGERIQLVDGLVSFVLVRNPGAAFSLATGMTWVLTVIALLVVVGIARYARRLRSAGWAVALGLILGGAIGNLVDRFFRGPGPMEGHVVDFVSVGWWPVFNVADSSICIGGAVLVLFALRGVDIDGTRRERPEPEGPRRPGDPRDRPARSAPARPVYPSCKWESPRSAGGPDARESQPTGTGPAEREER